MFSGRHFERSVTVLYLLKTGYARSPAPAWRDVPGKSARRVCAIRQCAATRAYRAGCDLADWIGITPRARSSGVKERLGTISKQGKKQLRTLLIDGTTSVLKQARRRLPAWIVSLMARKRIKSPLSLVSCNLVFAPAF